MAVHLQQIAFYTFSGEGHGLRYARCIDTCCGYKGCSGGLHRIEVDDRIIGRLTVHDDVRVVNRKRHI